MIISHSRSSRVWPFRRNVTRSEGLVAWWPLRQPLSAIDLGGFNKNGTVFNGLTWSPLLGHGLLPNFDGSDDYIQIADSDLDLENDFTVMAWIRSNNTASFQGIVAWGDDASPPTGRARGISIWSDGDLFFRGNSANVVSTFNVWDGNAHHCAASCDSSNNVVVYGDGQQVASGTPTLNTFTYTNTKIGQVNDLSFNEDFSGAIWDVRIYDRVLDPQEIEFHYLDRYALQISTRSVVSEVSVVSSASNLPILENYYRQLC